MRPKLFAFLVALMLAAVSVQAATAPLFSKQRLSIAAGVNYRYTTPIGAAIPLKDALEPNAGLYFGYNLGKFGAFTASGKYNFGNPTGLSKSLEYEVGLRTYLFKGWVLP